MDNNAGPSANPAQKGAGSDLDKYPSESAQKMDDQTQKSPDSAPVRDLPKLPRDEEENMIRTLRTKFKGGDVEELHNLLSSLELADKERRSGSPSLDGLAAVLDQIDMLWRSNSTYMAEVAEMLADASRDAKWRPFFGQSGILDYFLRIISTEEVEEDTLLHSLRFIGNSCADTDENRARVLEMNYTLPIIQWITHLRLVHVAIPVIYNICIDYVPAQAQVAQNGISIVLLKLLETGKLKGSALLGVTYELLEMASEQSQSVDITPDESLPLIIHAISSSESHGEGYGCLLNALNGYLQKDKFQQLSIINGHVEALLSIFMDTFKGDDSIMAPLRLKLNHSLADISALAAYPKYYPLRCSVTETLISWLASEKDDLKICACIILGNVARDDEVCKSMLHDFKVHLPLISMLKREDSKATVLHCSLGFLKNLAIAGDNREYLGEADIIKAASRLWAIDTLPHAQLMATSLTRQTILTSVTNIGRLLEPISSDYDSPGSRRTYLSLLLALFGKTDSSPIKTEIGRTIAAICRTLMRLKGNSELPVGTEELVTRLFDLHKDIARPIGTMITQTEWPIVQSEGWFALALVASHPAGSQAVIDCLESMCVIQSLCDTIRTPISHPEPGEPAKDKTERLKKSKDRENALFLLHGLMRNNAASELPESLRDMFEGLLREAGHEPVK
ncbi:hypothetical protein MGYG_07325 [Nannizzia gypsea CBS 118893]|uniref:GTP binding protein n=1 Tax=Arthroderma gypseum (strain ATCC MYA-4604 / CBS 118893) TaxID=535722 RepID=E4V2U4_ARTGP|nr:hypothetical protein MGYG_07325 [Nannizzia gypsea CBS 118893]EFR04318.1 hypothetical protein MGYG_07325 [Nannizzia gypsea CBS 118893]